MNEGQYIALRNYAEEQSSLLRQILDELKQRKAPAPQATAKPAAKATPRKIPAAAVGPVTVETVKEAPLKTTETVQVVDTPVVPRRVEQMDPVEMAVRPPAIDPSAHTTTQTGGRG